MLRLWTAVALMGAASLMPSPSHGKPDAFGAYPAAVYGGKPVAPAFKGAQRPYAAYRTRILQAIAAGPRFGGHYAMAVIGCGAGCRFGYIADLKTGTVYDLPLGGEDYAALLYRGRANSNLLQAQWEVSAASGDDPGCATQDFVWTGKAFRALGAPLIVRDACPPWDGAGE